MHDAANIRNSCEHLRECNHQKISFYFKIVILSTILHFSPLAKRPFQLLWVTRKEGRIKAFDYREAPHLKYLVQGSEQHQRGAEEGG